MNHMWTVFKDCDFMWQWIIKLWNDIYVCWVLTQQLLVQEPYRDVQPVTSLETNRVALDGTWRAFVVNADWSTLSSSYILKVQGVSLSVCVSQLRSLCQLVHGLWRHTPKEVGDVASFSKKISYWSIRWFSASALPSPSIILEWGCNSVFWIDSSLFDESYVASVMEALT